MQARTICGVFFFDENTLKQCLYSQKAPPTCPFHLLACSASATSRTPNTINYIYPLKKSSQKLLLLSFIFENSFFSRNPGTFLSPFFFSSSSAEVYALYLERAIKGKKRKMGMGTSTFVIRWINFLTMVFFSFLVLSFFLWKILVWFFLVELNLLLHFGMIPLHLYDYSFC